MTPRLLCGWLLLLVGCRGTLSPLSNKLDIGTEGYIAFTADGEDGLGDLFAAPLTGGTAYQITFSRVEERLPALSPDGVMLAFARARAPGDTGVQSVTVTNLLNGSERPIGGTLSGAPRAIAWSPDGSLLYVRTTTGLDQAPAPPAAGRWAPVPAEDQAAADSSFLVRLGDPPLGVAQACDSTGLCVRMLDGSLAPISPTGEHPVRWLGDSVLYLEGGEWLVRPLAGGKTRPLRWTRPITGIRELTLFAGRR